jgi:hypothetical protein
MKFLISTDLIFSSCGKRVVQENFHSLRIAGGQSIEMPRRGTGEEVFRMFGVIGVAPHRCVASKTLNSW